MEMFPLFPQKHQSRCKDFRWKNNTVGNNIYTHTHTHTKLTNIHSHQSARMSSDLVPIPHFTLALYYLAFIIRFKRRIIINNEQISNY